MQISSLQSPLLYPPNQVFLSQDSFSQPQALDSALTSIGGLLSQAGVPTTDSQGGFGMGSAQTLGAHAGQQRRPPPNKEVDPLRWEPLPMPMETKEASSWGKGL